MTTVRLTTFLHFGICVVAKILSAVVQQHNSHTALPRSSYAHAETAIGPNSPVRLTPICNEKMDTHFCDYFGFW